MRRLRELRLEQGLSIYNLAEEARITPATISRIENGHTTPKPSTLQKLAEALGVRPRDITRLTLSLEPPTSIVESVRREKVMRGPGEWVAIDVRGNELRPVLTFLGAYRRNPSVMSLIARGRP